MEKKEYTKPIFNEESVEILDIIASSGDFGDSGSNDSRVTFGDIWS